MFAAGHVDLPTVVLVVPVPRDARSVHSSVSRHDKLSRKRSRHCRWLRCPRLYRKSESKDVDENEGQFQDMGSCGVDLDLAYMGSIQFQVLRECVDSDNRRPSVDAYCVQRLIRYSAGQRSFQGQRRRHLSYPRYH